MAFFRNLFKYRRTAQPRFEESQKYWIEEELRKLERAIESMQETYNPSYMGSFKSTATQTAATSNTPTAVTFNTVDYEMGVYRGSPTSRIYFDNAGWYNLEFTLQVQHIGSAQASDVVIWVNYLGAPVPNSATRVHIKGQNESVFASWNFTGQATGGDYVELMWSTTRTDTVLYAEAATASVPAIPSARITLTQIAK
jgi:hypothetical protein